MFANVSSERRRQIFELDEVGEGRGQVMFVDMQDSLKTGTAIVLLVLGFASPVAAFDSRELGQYGSLRLADLMPLIKNTPKLNNEVMEAVLKLGKKPEEIICGGKRF